MTPLITSSALLDTEAIEAVLRRNLLGGAA